MLLSEEVSDDVRLFLPTVKRGAHGTDELGLVGRTALAQSVGLDVLVEQFVGVELRAVPGNELAHSDAAVHRMAVDNEDDLGRAVF